MEDKNIQNEGHTNSRSGKNTSVSEISDDDVYSSLRENYEQQGSLSEEEVDIVADTAIVFLKPLFSLFGEKDIKIDEYDGENGELILNVSGGDLAILIGRHGRALEALQTVLGSYLSSKMKFHYPVIIDIEAYRSRRRDKVHALAISAANRVKKTHGKSSLPSMSSYERRIVHLTLVDDPQIVTYSEGEDPERHVVVAYTSKKEHN
jgi:spoIIIJ-associated protein